MSEKNLETMDHRFTVAIKTLWSLSQENLTYREEEQVITQTCHKSARFSIVFPQISARLSRIATGIKLSSKR